MIDPAANTAAVAAAARAAVRDVPDFPKPGVLFKDITPLLANEALFRSVTGALGAPFAADRISLVVGVESRGFLFGAPVAQALRAGFVPVRKPGKLPPATIREEYTLEYGTDALEVHADAIRPGANVLIVDDVLATGGTAAAAVKLIGKMGAELVLAQFLIELEFLDGRKNLPGTAIKAFLTF